MRSKTFQEALAIMRKQEKRARQKRKARLAAAEGAHTDADLAAIRKFQNDRCAYCKTRLNGKGSRDHIVPLVGGGSNAPENMQWLCKYCSSMKGSKSEDQFLAKIFVAFLALAKLRTLREDQ